MFTRECGPDDIGEDRAEYNLSDSFQAHHDMTGKVF